MIPILYDTNEVAFTSNGLGRLSDVISCVVTEERNNIYECDFSYPVNGRNYDLIKIGRIVGVSHGVTGLTRPTFRREDITDEEREDRKSVV